ncbi:hypothetical protein POM88_023499 [Heracleum sosnowskyi]|uniref:Uncharacterized protein n=1 Tax=Heracleum sosnowskyi TaxID=360622 RepID=A0AAD8IH49_9APIA|nr:hypothetical protein POM88_023499 [Heracleum sosnowskyi]
MERNRQRCRALGVPELAVGVSAAFKKDKGKSKGKKNIRDEDEYIEESEEQSEDDASEILPKKTQKVKKNKVLNGPTTRSRSNAVTTTENGSTQNDKNEAAANSGMVEPAKTQLPCCQGLGSMVDYLAMRERKQKEATSAIATGSGTKNDKVPETDLPDIEMEEVEADDEQPDDQQPDGEQPDGEQPDDDLYYAKIFAKTRKRKPGRKYQSNPDVMEFRIDTINKKLGSSEGLDGLDELVSGAKKSHGRGWLIGRHDPKCLKTSTSAPAPTDSYVQELTKKIRQEVAVEVEAKVNQKVRAEVDGKINRKVQDNLTLALKKLAEANPTLNVDIGEICATISSDTVGISKNLDVNLRERAGRFDVALYQESLVSPYGYICQGHVGRQHMARKWNGKELRRAENGGIRTIRLRGMSVSLAGPDGRLVKGGIAGLLGGWRWRSGRT